MVLYRHSKHATPISHVIATHYNLDIPQQLWWIKCYTDLHRSWPHIITCLEQWIMKWKNDHIHIKYRDMPNILCSFSELPPQINIRLQIYTLLPPTHDECPGTHTLVTFDADFEVESCYSIIHGHLHNLRKRYGPLTQLLGRVPEWWSPSHCVLENIAKTSSLWYVYSMLGRGS